MKRSTIFSNENTLYYTALASVYSIAAGLGGFIYQALYYSAWHMSTGVFLELGSEKILFVAVSGLLYSIAWTILAIVLHELYAKNLPLVVVYKRVKTQIKSLDKKTYSDAKDIEEGLSYLSRDVHKNNIRIIFETFFLCTLPMAIIYSIAFEQTFLIQLLCSFVVTIFTMVITYYDTLRISRKTIEISLGKTPRPEDDEKRKIRDCLKAIEWAIEYTKQGETIENVNVLGESFSMKDVFRFSFSSIICFLVIIITIGLVRPYSRKDYWCYEDDNVTYVLIAEKDGKMHLREAAINDDRIEIYANKQTIREEGIPLMYRLFESVTIKDKS